MWSVDFEHFFNIQKNGTFENFWKKNIEIQKTLKIHKKTIDIEKDGTFEKWGPTSKMMITMIVMIIMIIMTITPSQSDPKQLNSYDPSWLSWSIARLYHCNIVLLYCCPIVLLYYCTIAITIQYRTIVLLYYCTTVLLYNCTTLLFY